MGLGNGNPKSGDKGSNFNYQLRVLQTLGQIAAGTGGGGGGLTLTEEDFIQLTSLLLLPVGGKAVDTPIYSPAYTISDAVMNAFDSINGGMLVNQANLAIDEDLVGTVPINTVSTFGMFDFDVIETTNTNIVTHKESAGVLYGWNIINTGANDVYVKFINQAAPIVGTSASRLKLLVPAGSSIFMEPNTRIYSFNDSLKFYVSETFLDTVAQTAPASVVRVETYFK